MYGNEIEEMIQGIKRARSEIDGGVLIAGKFGEFVVTGQVWDDIVDGKDRMTLMRELLGVFGEQDKVVRVLGDSPKGLIGVMKVRPWSTPCFIQYCFFLVLASLFALTFEKISSILTGANYGTNSLVFDICQHTNKGLASLLKHHEGQLANK